MCAKRGDLPMALRLQCPVAMKKSTKKLSLRTQTIRLLTQDALDQVAGGDLGPVGPVEQGFIMKDSIIVRTSTR
jgi:hypothetical protein